MIFNTLIFSTFRDQDCIVFTFERGILPILFRQDHGKDGSVKMWDNMKGEGSV